MFYVSKVSFFLVIASSVQGKPDLCLAPRAALTTALSVVRARQTGQCRPPTSPVTLALSSQFKREAPGIALITGSPVG